MSRAPRAPGLASALLLALALAAPAAPQAGPGEAVGGDPAVVVGDVTATRALLHVQTAGPAPVAVTLEPAGPGGVRRTLSLQPDEALVARAALDGLAPGREHRYRVASPGRTVEGTFVTAPAPGVAAPVRLAWSGDLGAGHRCDDGPYGVLDAVAARRPDLFVFAGDTVYADDSCPALPGGAGAAGTPAGFRARYRHNIGDAAVQRLLRRTSVVAIWDDHEVTGNFAGPREPLMPVGRAAFREAWPVLAPPAEPTRLYRRLQWGALLDLFVLDTRQYRSPNWRLDGPDKTMLGQAQRRWLLEAVGASAAAWKVIVSSVPISLTKGWPVSDSWAARGILGLRTGFAHERDAILRALAAQGVRDLVVLAADVHFATAIAHAPAPGLSVLELVAGPLAAGTKDPRAPAPGLDSRVLFAHGDEPTFGELAVTAEGLDVRFFGGDGRLLWEHRVPRAAPDGTRPAR